MVTVPEPVPKPPLSQTYCRCRSISVVLLPPTQFRASRGFGMLCKSLLRKFPNFRTPFEDGTVVLEGATALTSTFTQGELSRRAKKLRSGPGGSHKTPQLLQTSAKALSLSDVERFVLPTTPEPFPTALNCQDRHGRSLSSGISIEVP